jgi:hypothetical protein
MLTGLFFPNRTFTYGNGDTLNLAIEGWNDLINGRGDLRLDGLIKCFCYGILLSSFRNLIATAKSGYTCQTIMTMP